MTLTEQWKKGELEQGYYYMQIPTGDIRIITECMKVDCKGFSILSKVPSYEEWQSKNEENKNLYKMLDVLNRHLNSFLKEDKENQQLKELLKECREFFEEENPKDFTVMSERMDELLTKIDNAIGEKK